MILAVFINKNNPNNWRVCERQSLEKIFGPIIEIGPDIDPRSIINYSDCKYVYWCHHCLTQLHK